MSAQLLVRTMRRPPRRSVCRKHTLSSDGRKLGPVVAESPCDCEPGHPRRAEKAGSGWLIMAATRAFLRGYYCRALKPGPWWTKLMRCDAGSLSRARVRAAADWLERRPQGRRVRARDTATPRPRQAGSATSPKAATGLPNRTACPGAGGGLSSSTGTTLAGQRRDRSHAPISRRCRADRR